MGAPSDGTRMVVSSGAAAMPPLLICGGPEVGAGGRLEKPFRECRTYLVDYPRPRRYHVKAGKMYLGVNSRVYRFQGTWGIQEVYREGGSKQLKTRMLRAGVPPG
jgi:hypothetical protein